MISFWYPTTIHTIQISHSTKNERYTVKSENHSQCSKGKIINSITKIVDWLFV